MNSNQQLAQVDDSLLDCIYALSWLVEDGSPHKKRAGEAIAKARQARETLTDLGLTGKPIGIFGVEGRDNI